MVAYLLDTNTCINYLKNRDSKVRQRLEQTDPASVFICSIVKAELYYGAVKGTNTAERLPKLEDFFRPFVSLPFDDLAAEAYGSIRSDLAKAGTPIGPYDLQIAAIARVNGLIVVTHNTDEFTRVQGLKVEDWEV